MEYRFKLNGQEVVIPESDFWRVHSDMNRFAVRQTIIDCAEGYIGDYEVTDELIEEFADDCCDDIISDMGQTFDDSVQYYFGEFAKEKELEDPYVEHEDISNAQLLWNHRDDENGYNVCMDASYWCICKGSEMIRLNRENGVADDDFYAYEPESYYLSSESEMTYRVGSAEDIRKVLDGEGNEFFVYC